MSENNDDTPVLTCISAEWTLEMLSESLKFGQNWECSDKRETASEWIVHSKFSFQSKRLEQSEHKIIIIPFPKSKKRT